MATATPAAAQPPPPQALTKQVEDAFKTYASENNLQLRPAQATIKVVSECWRSGVVDDEQLRKKVWALFDGDDAAITKFVA